MIRIINKDMEYISMWFKLDTAFITISLLFRKIRTQKITFICIVDRIMNSWIGVVNALAVETGS